MSCSCSTIEWRERYPDTAIAMYLTDPSDSDPPVDGDMADANNGALEYLEKSGNAWTSGPGSKTIQNAATGPYSIRMRPVTDHKFLQGSPNSLLKKLEYFPIDVTLEGSSHQQSAVLAAIAASKSTDDAYALSFYRNSPVNFWQPNFFRPEFIINGKNILKGIQASNYDTKTNKGDISIGLPLPYCFDLDQPVGNINRIKAFAQLTQIVDVSGTPWYQRYGVLCVATFWTGNKYQG